VTDFLIAVLSVATWDCVAVEFNFWMMFLSLCMGVLALMTTPFETIAWAITLPLLGMLFCMVVVLALMPTPYGMIAWAITLPLLGILFCVGVVLASMPTPPYWMITWVITLASSALGSVLHSGGSCFDTGGGSGFDTHSLLDNSLGDYPSSARHSVFRGGGSCFDAHSLLD
jgi:hypothetical protein